MLGAFLSLGEHAGDIEPNAFIRQQAQMRCEWKSRVGIDSKIKKVSECLPAKKNTVFDISWQNRSDFQAHMEKLSDFLLPGHGVWWHFDDDSIVMHDVHGKDYATLLVYLM